MHMLCTLLRCHALNVIATRSSLNNTIQKTQTYFPNLYISSMQLKELLEGDLNSEAEEGVDVIECDDGSIAALLEDRGTTNVTTESAGATINYLPVLNPAGETDLGERTKGGVGVSIFKSKDYCMAPSVHITNEMRIAEEGDGVTVSDANSEQSLVLKHYRTKKKKKKGTGKGSRQEELSLTR
ncbi:hypothetical protein Pyn_34437 [Prunus yedoensis var. nudiflora]|uniref:Uncharacterized protein n=1 Tax=Prunus yedoensis var. nudiflora TaxID=2094558 RepID=A0A314YDX7_PRUYE|nr:hypothetical protein Pyn_34437 [Prunus yedoensis var. nudiflora]